VVAVALALVLSGALSHGSLLGALKVPEVTVTDILLSFTPSNDPCFTSDYENSTPGTVVAGGTVTFVAAIVDQADGSARDCALTSVNVTTPGFVLVASNLPLNVSPSGSAQLNLTLRAPTISYDGPLNLTANASFELPNVHVLAQNVTFDPSGAAGACGVSVFGSGGFTQFSATDFDDSIGFFVISPAYYCTITAVSTPTSGFSVVSSQTPVSLPIDSIASVSFVLALPETAYSGNLSLTVTLSEFTGG
jgi:hypothetical protein